MRRSALGYLAAISLSFTLAACQADLQHGLNEAQANEILVLLDANSISGNKSLDARSGNWIVSVPKGELRRSWQLMQAFGLPRRPVQGFETTFEHSGLIPTTTEDRVRIQQATAGELERSLMAMASVVDARVHLVIPEINPIRARLEQPPPPRASVLLVYQESEEIAPINTVAVQRLVAGAVDRLQAENVIVVSTPHQVRVPQPGQGLAQFGPLTVAEASLSPLRMILGGLILLNLLLGAGLVYIILRGSRSSVRA